MKTYVKGLVCAVIVSNLGINTAISAPLTADAAGKIMAKSGCYTCHALDKDKIGPAYTAVAERYAKPSPVVLAYLKGEKPADYLFKKVRTGTKMNVNKNWIKSPAGKPYGMMTPHSPTKIKDEDLKAVLEFVLTYKK